MRITFFKPVDVTVAELLKEANYVTGGVGKWAMGGIGTTGHPNHNGFDYWFGYLDQGQAHNYYPPYLWRNKEKIPLKGECLNEFLLRTEIEYHQKESLILTMLLPLKRKVLSENTENNLSCFIFTGLFLTRITKEEEPLATAWKFLTMAFMPMKIGHQSKKGAAAMISKMDHDVGKILKLLQELELDKKTFVFFTSDNGPHSEGGHKT